MILPDVNVLVYAFHEGAPDHMAYRNWLTEHLSSDDPIGLSELVLSGFVGVATHPRIFERPADRQAHPDATIRPRVTGPTVSQGESAGGNAGRLVCGLASRPS